MSKYHIVGNLYVAAHIVFSPSNPSISLSAKFWTIPEFVKLGKFRQIINFDPTPTLNR